MQTPAPCQMDTRTDVDQRNCRTKAFRCESIFRLKLPARCDRCRPTPVIGQDHHCRSAASPHRTFMAPRSIVQGPKVSGAGHSRHSPKRSDLCRDRETFCWMGGKLPFAALATNGSSAQKWKFASAPSKLGEYGKTRTRRLTERPQAGPSSHFELGIYSYLRLLIVMSQDSHPRLLTVTRLHARRARIIQ